MEGDGAEVSKLKGKLITGKKGSDAATKPDEGGKLGGRLKARSEGKELVDSRFAVTAVLQVKDDEDGPPLARIFEVDSGETPGQKTKIGFVSVADGLGGAGAKSALVVKSDVEKSMGYIAAREAQKAARKVVDLNPQILSGTLDDIRDTLESALGESKIITAEIPSSLKGKVYKNFPTTFSSAVVQETAAGKRVMMFWAGDSPIIVFTPDKIYTTYTPGAGDAPMGDEAIHRGNHGLKARQLDFPPDTPLLVVAASDGLLKLGSQEFELAKELILNGVKNNPPEEIATQLARAYQARKALGTVEEDDATIGMVGSGELSALSVAAPTQAIF